MKYAKEVIDLMAAHPNRKFRMANIINNIDRKAQGAARLRIRVGVLRVLKTLESNGHVEIELPERQGGASLYQWKVIHEHQDFHANMPQSDRGSDTLGAGQVAP